MPNIAVLNSSTVLPDSDITPMLGAFRKQWNNDVAPSWNIEQADFTFVAKGQTPPAGAWWLVFLDDSDQAQALAYHDLTSDGLPLSKVFVRTIQTAGSSLSVGATHELCEMAVDPWLNIAFQDSTGTFWAGEICDPVEDDSYGYEIDGVLVSDFVTPAWFAYKSSQGRLDCRQHATTAFSVLSGGYAQKFDPQGGWVQVDGAKASQSPRFTAALGSRRERRARTDTRSRGASTWTLSEPADRPEARRSEAAPEAVATPA